MRIDFVPNAGRKCLGKVTSPASVGICDLGSCVKGRATGPRRLHRRPARVEAGTQPRDGCAADLKNRPGRWKHSDLGGRGIEALEPLQPLQKCPTGENVGRAWLNPSHQYPLGGCSESAMLDPAQPVPDSGTRILQVSRAGNAGKPETVSIIDEQQCCRPDPGPKCSFQFHKILSVRSEQLLSPQSEGEKPPYRTQQLPPGSTDSDVAERFLTPVQLGAPIEAPKRLRLRGQRESVIL